MYNKNTTFFWYAIIIFISLIIYNSLTLKQITGHKIGQIIESENGNYQFKFVTTQNDTLFCVYPAPNGTNIGTKAAIEIQSTKNLKRATLYGKRKGTKFIVYRISN